MDTTTPVSSPAVRLRTIAIPPEHGAWGFLLEPLLLGLGVAPSVPGVCLAVGVIGAFLARHPLKMAVLDRMRGRRYARTRLAERVALTYSMIAGLGLVSAITLAGIHILLPLLLGIPLAGIMFVSYAQNRGRDLLPELAGAAALALAAPSLALAGDKRIGVALALWAVLLARDIPSILYVRARLRLERDKPYALVPVLAANILGTAEVLFLAWIHLAPALAAAAMILLLIRALYGLSPYRQRVRTPIIGFQEIGFGLMTVLLTILGYGLNL